MSIFSVDPGYERLGLAIINGSVGNEKLAFSECFITSSKTLHSVRLSQIGEKIDNVLDTHTPKLLAIETLYFNTNQKTAIKVSEARGVVIERVARRGIPVVEFTPGQIKIAVTGYGKSEKAQVINMTKQLITIPDKKTYDDEYDAIAVGLTAIASL